MPFHWAEFNANQVTQSAFDPISREPNYKQCAVRVERAATSANGDHGDTRMKHLVVVGNGMAGVACVEQILKYQPSFEITIFGDETHVNYNRILLSSVLAGERSEDEIVLNPREWYQRNNIRLHVGTRVTDVDPQVKTVTSDDGGVTPYDTLLLATGSNPFMPRIEGLDRDNVFVFRTLDDTRKLLQRAGPGVRAVVIGGGLLGLEAARGLQVQGCDVTVIHLMATLMERQLDPNAGNYLAGKMEDIGIRVLLGESTTAIVGDTRAEGVALEDGTILEADLVVVAAGIRPNVELGYKAGLKVNRGIVVNDYMETSDPDIFAVGECVEHRGHLLRPRRAAARAGQGAGGHDHRQQRAGLHRHDQASKLKIMGVDVFSAGDWSEQQRRAGAFQDRALGIYKKLTIRDGKLVARFSSVIRRTAIATWTGCVPAPTLGTPSAPSVSPAGGRCRARHRGNVRQRDHLRLRRRHKGDIIQAIHERGVNTLSQLKETHARQHGLRQLHALCQALLKAVAPEFEEETRKVLCGCVPLFAGQPSRDSSQPAAQSVQEVLDIYGNGQGCEVCKPALSYMLDMLWCGDHDEDRSARFINDRVHANIQKDGTFSVVPRIRGGVTTPAELRRIADVAEKYHVPMVKVTGSQRIDLLGVKKEDLPNVWADLGMPSARRTPKACAW